MPETEAPDETPETSSSKISLNDSISSESDSLILSDYEYEFSLPKSVSASSDSEVDIETYTLTAPGYEKIRIPIEQNLRQHLVKFAGTDDLEAVTTLKLKVIARDFSLQRLPAFLPNLIELNLDGSCLMSLRDLGCDLNTLKILRVSRCGLNSLDGLLGLQGLVELYAGGNNIKSVSACASLPHIEILDLRQNNISEAAPVSFLALCTTLKRLILEECPVTKIENYRGIVKTLLPDLLYLDGLKLTDEDSLIGTTSVTKEPDAIITSRFPPIPQRFLKESPDKFFESALKRPNTAGLIRSSTKNKITRPASACNATNADFNRIVNDNSDFNFNVRKYFYSNRISFKNQNLPLQISPKQAWTK